MDIIIFDTGDNYIITPINESYNVAKELYSMIGITINEMVTNVQANKDTLQFIYDSIGRIISYGFRDTDSTRNVDLPLKLKMDIANIVEFAKIKSFWENLQYPNEWYDRKKQDFKDDAKSDKPLSDNIMKPLTMEDLLPTTSKWTYDATVYDSLLFCDVSKESNNTVVKQYVLYNNIYNVALLVDNTTVPNICELIKYFPEFVVVFDYTLGCNEIKYNSEIQLFLENIFHKTSFESLEDIKKKVDAFKMLYVKDIPCDTAEKSRVKQFLDKHFDISDPLKRMKANDLYTEFINNLLIPFDEASAFKKRLGGYLIEFNLHKKRFSDEYYYYGLSKKEYVTPKLEQILEMRMKEKQKYSFNKP